MGVVVVYRDVSAVPRDVLLVKNFLEPLDEPAVDRVPPASLGGHLHDHARLLLRHVE